eukprot:4577648-Alexandrium_andersonii.AAC.1
MCIRDRHSPALATGLAGPGARMLGRPRWPANAFHSNVEAVTARPPRRGLPRLPSEQCLVVGYRLESEDCLLVVIGPVQGQEVETRHADRVATGTSANPNAFL